MFENITKGEFYLSGNCISTDDVDICELGFKNKEQNAEFIAYCFNLQQRFDIGKLEEAIKLLDFIFDRDICDVRTDKKLNLLLTKIKKSKVKKSKVK